MIEILAHSPTPSAPVHSGPGYKLGELGETDVDIWMVLAKNLNTALSPHYLFPSTS